MGSRKSVILAAAIAIFSLPAAAEVLSLDSCRSLAVANNKQLLITAEQIKAAGYQRKEAFAAYLPAFDFAGGYMYNQKEISIFDSDQLLPTKTFNPATGSYDFNLVTDPATHMPVKGPDGQYIPSTVALIPKDAMTFNIHNVFFGAVTLTQPIYMGGKIMALNRLAGYAEQLAKDMHAAARQDVVYAVDAAYWQVVSLSAKQKLAVSYVNLLDSLDRNVALMVDNGVATKADKLTVDVKLNEAQIDLTKVNNGLVLSRMLLAELCGLPVDADIHVIDEAINNVKPSEEVATVYNMQEVYNARHDIHALEMLNNMADEQKNVAVSAMLPNVALVGTYSFSNPNMFDGFKRRFDGAFSVGVMVKIPLWHWGGNINKINKAKADQQIARLTLEDAKEKIALQVSQASFKTEEAMKTYLMTIANEAKAQENLDNAQYGFQEGVLTTDNVLEAQTAWLKANSEKIDAMIDVQLCDTYLTKVLGRSIY